MHPESFNVEVCVIDKNDNVPSFIEGSMRGSVQLGLLKGDVLCVGACVCVCVRVWFTVGDVLRYKDDA